MPKIADLLNTVQEAVTAYQGNGRLTRVELNGAILECLPREEGVTITFPTGINHLPRDEKYLLTSELPKQLADLGYTNIVVTETSTRKLPPAPYKVTEEWKLYASK